MSADRAEVETILGSILASEQNGLSLRRLDREYCSTVGTSIPFQEFGHTSLAAFLGSMPEVVTVEGGSGEDLTARAAYNAATAHITKLVAEQKPGPIRVRRQQTQRPCHWKVHPYHKNPPQRSRYEDTENSSWTRGTMPFKKEPKQGPFVSGPKNSYLLSANTAQASSSTRSSLPRLPVAAARHPKVPVSSPAPVRKPLKDVPANVVQQSGGSSWHSNTTGRAPRPGQKYPAAQNYTHGYGFHKANVNTWMWFLKQAGVVRQRAVVYAKLLMWQGMNPSSMWLLTGQDIFQMGIGDFRDIHLIQEHAHQLHAMHRSSASNGSLLDEAGYLNPHHEGSEDHCSACNFVHVPLRHNQRWTNDRRVAFKNEHSFRHPARHGHNRSATAESEQWLDHHLHLTPPLRRCRDLRLKHGFSVTPLNLRSVVGGSSIKERLGWRR